MADEKIGLSDEQQQILDAAFYRQALHQTQGQAYLRCYATNDLPAEAKDAKFALAKIVDDLQNLRMGKLMDSGLKGVDYAALCSEIDNANKVLAEASMWVTRAFTLLR